MLAAEQVQPILAEAPIIHGESGDVPGPDLRLALVGHEVLIGMARQSNIAWFEATETGDVDAELRHIEDAEAYLHELGARAARDLTRYQAHISLIALR